MKLLRMIPRVGGMPEMQVFSCAACKYAETIAQDPG